MNLQDFAHLNHQLAGMLRSGIPLEGALRQTSASLQSGALRQELQALEADLAAGQPLAQALQRRQLPDFYVRMLEIGARTQDFPGLLTMLADYYQRLHASWVRLQGLIFYPALVLLLSFLVSLLVATIFARFRQEMFEAHGGLVALAPNSPTDLLIRIGLWFPVALTAGLCGLMTLILARPRWRERLRWRLPAFRDARLAHLAGSIHLLLRGGCTLDAALQLVERLETQSPAGAELARWRERLAQGHARFADLAEGSREFPPLFVWLISSGGENLADGFRHAAEVYHERAERRTDLMLYAVLPTAVLTLGCLILVQLIPFTRVFSTFAQQLVDPFAN